MPTDLPPADLDELSRPDQQAALLSDALSTGDALLVSQALHRDADVQ